MSKSDYATKQDVEDIVTDEVQVILGAMGDRFEQVEGRLDRVEIGLERVEERLSAVEDRLEGVERKLGSTIEQIDKHDKIISYNLKIDRLKQRPT